MPVKSLPSIPPNSEILNLNRFHSGPATKLLIAGSYPKLLAYSMRRQVLPSPLAQNEISSLEDRLAGAVTVAPGEKIAPAQAYGRSGEISPVINNDPRLPCAPSGATFISALDLPPATASVETDQPEPNFVETFSSSKSLTDPDSEPAGAAMFRRPSASAFIFSIDAM